MYLRMYLCQNLSLSMFLECSYFFTKSEADVLINSVLRQNTACIFSQKDLKKTHCSIAWQSFGTKSSWMIATAYDRTDSNYVTSLKDHDR